jgi:hypothetical protein
MATLAFWTPDQVRGDEGPLPNPHPVICRRPEANDGYRPEADISSVVILKQVQDDEN